MKNLNKKLKKVIGIATIVGMTCSLPQISSAATYNMNASNCLDNLTKDGNDTVISFVLKDAEQTITENKIKTDFKNKGLTVKNISTGSTIGTGTKITVNENNITYNVLIYGDVNKDGVVDIFDITSIVNHIIRTDSKLTGLSLKAANVDNAGGDAEIDIFDITRIVSFIINSSSLVAETPTIIPADTQAPKITLNGNAEITIVAGTNYTELGATADDNFDGNITNKIITSGTVNTNVPNTYTIKYTVTDSSGNKSEATRKVIVTNKITGLSLTDTSRNNVTVVSGEYQTNSKENFVLGKITSTAKANPSPLKANQIVIEKSVTATDDNTVTSNDLAIKVNNDFTVSGKANKVGTYKIKAYVMSGNEKISLDEIELQVVKSKTVGSIDLTKIDDNEVRSNKFTPVIKTLTVKNVNGEEIPVTSESITITDEIPGITVTKLDAEENEATSNDTIVTKLQISTTLNDITLASFKINIGNVTKEITFNVGVSELLKVSIPSEVSIYSTEPGGSADIIIQTNGRLYTLLPIDFISQYNNEKMSVEASRIGIGTSDKDINITVDDKLDVKLFDSDRNEATGDASVVYLGIAMKNANGSLEDIVDKSISIECGDETSTITAKAGYKAATRINLDTTGAVNATVGEGQNTIVAEDTDFVLGTLTSGQNEEPLTISSLAYKVTNSKGTDVTKTFGSISFEEDENGNILLKGNASTKDVYQLQIYIKDNESVYKNISLKVTEPTIDPDTLTISFTAVEESGTTVNGYNVTIESTNEGEAYLCISAGDRKIKKSQIKESNENDADVTIEYLDANLTELSQNAEADYVDYLVITIPQASGTNRTVKMTVLGKKVTLNITVL